MVRLRGPGITPRGPEPGCRAGFPACRFTGLSSPVSARPAGTSPAPPDSNPCRAHARSRRGSLVIELVVAMGILAAVMIPMAYVFDQEVLSCRVLYQEAVATELLDGEMEILAAGEWRAFPAGTRPYTVRGAAAVNLPRGRFMLTVASDRVRLEWQPERPGHGRSLSREVKVP